MIHGAPLDSRFLTLACNLNSTKLATELPTARCSKISKLKKTSSADVLPKYIALLPIAGYSFEILK
jgi:hypothetical protein